MQGNGIGPGNTKQQGGWEESKNSEASAIAEQRESLRSRGGARGSYTPEKRRETQSEVSYGTQTERESEGQ